MLNEIYENKHFLYRKNAFLFHNACKVSLMIITVKCEDIITNE